MAGLLLRWSDLLLSPTACSGVGGRGRSSVPGNFPTRSYQGWGTVRDTLLFCSGRTVC